MVEQKDLVLTSSHKHTRVTTNCWTAVDRDWNLPKKVFHIQRHEEEPTARPQGMHSRYNQIPYPPDRRPTNWGIIIFQDFSYRSKLSEPHMRFPSLGVWHWEEEPSELLALKTKGAWLQCPTGLRERGTHSWRVHTRCDVPRDPGQKQLTIGAFKTIWRDNSWKQPRTGTAGSSIQD